MKHTNGNSMNKYVRDGSVAVIYSPGFGAGWSTWDTEGYGNDLIFDPTLVDMILNDANKQMIIEYITLKYPDMSRAGADDLAVAWVPEGTLFKIREYDGSESVEVFDEKYWIKA